MLRSSSRPWDWLPFLSQAGWERLDTAVTARISRPLAMQLDELRDRFALA